MPNVSFNDTELSTLGYSVQTLDARGITSWKPQTADILNRYTRVDLGGGYDIDDTQTVVTGTLSAPYDMDTWDQYNKDVLLDRLQQIKSVLDPETVGYAKLVITGDDTNHYRWCRFSAAPFEEQLPIFKVPFVPLQITFDNLEPWWRQAADDVTLTGSPSASKPLPNDNAKSRPVIKCTVGSSKDVSDGVTLFIIDGIAVNWTSDETILDFVSGDVITIDCDNLTATILKRGEDNPRDAIRAVSVTPATSDGFPVIAHGGSTITGKDSSISSAEVSYDLLTL